MSTVTCRVPNDEQVGELLAGLLGREVTAVWVPGSWQPPPVVRVASYRTDAGELAAVAVADAAFACRAGAALVLVPAGGADEAVDAGEIPPQLDENFHEVVNVMASLLNEDGGAHVRLTAVEPLGRSVPAEVAAVVADPSKRRVFHVTVDGYGRGTVALLFA